MSSVRFATPHESKKTDFRFPSSGLQTSLTKELLYQDPIQRPSSTQPTRFLTLSQDGSSSKPYRNSLSSTQQPTHTHRPASISKLPLPLPPPLPQHLQPPRSSISTTVLRPRTQSLSDVKPPLSSSSLVSAPPHQRSWLVPRHQSRTPSPSPSGPRHSIGSIKKSLIETIDSFSCSLEDKLTLVAKLHAEVEAELTHLNVRGFTSAYHSERNSVPHHTHSKKEIEDTIRLIKHANRIKAHAIQQLQHDIGHSHTALHPPHSYSHSHSHQTPHSSKMGHLSRELH